MSEKEKSHPIRLLFADDDDDDRNLFMQVIDEIGANVELSTARDGYVLMHALSEIEWLPDIIFLDLNMPRKNGSECLAEIRSDKKLNHIPVVIFSTSSSEKDITDTYNKGANLYVLKPRDFNMQKTLFIKLLSVNWNNFLPHSLKENYFINENSSWFIQKNISISF